MIPEHIIDTIIGNLDLPELIGETVPLAKRVGTFEGLCPFHKEETPSFKVYADHYHCYGCGAHGNGIDFLTGKFGLSFPEAVKQLSVRTGVPMPERNRATAPDPQAAMLDVLQRASKVYHDLLFAPVGNNAFLALSERGIDDDTIVRFGIGYAPDGWGTLSDDKAFRRSDLIAAGLSVQRQEKRGCYDFFRHRLMFPVRAENGDVLGFGGRRIGEEGPKYLNSPETPCYQKGRVLFGLQQATSAIRASGAIIVCEGFFDVITPAQAGIENIVSTCGTALTPIQAQMVLSLADRVFFCFDGDAAGAKATWRAAELLVPMVSDHHEIRLCRLPEGDDPDSFVRKQGAAAFQRLLDSAPTLSAYLVGELTRGARLPESRTRALAVAAALHRQFAAPGLATFFRQYLCESLSLSPEDFDRLISDAPRREGDDTLRACPCCSGGAALLCGNEGFQIQCSHCRLSTPVTQSEVECRGIWNRREKPRMRPATATTANNK